MISGDLHKARVNASMLDVSLPMCEDYVRTVVNERILKVVFRNLRRNASHQQVFCRLPGYENYAHSTVIVAGLLRMWDFCLFNLENGEYLCVLMKLTSNTLIVLVWQQEWHLANTKVLLCYNVESLHACDHKSGF